MEDSEWGKPEIAAFSEVYSVNNFIYDAMSFLTPYLIDKMRTQLYNVFVND